MVVGEAPVDVGEQQVVLARQQLSELLDHPACRTVAGIPADPVRAAGIACHQPPDIGVLDVIVADGAFALFPVALGAHAAELLDVFAEERLVLQHHLEAVVVGRVMAAGDHDAAVDLQRRLGVIEHRRRPQADPHHVDAALRQALDQRRFELDRGDATVAAHRHAGAAGAAHDRAEAAADRGRIRRAQGFADHPADVIFAQRGGVEDVAHGFLPGIRWRQIARRRGKFNVASGRAARRGLHSPAA